MRQHLDNSDPEPAPMRLKVNKQEARMLILLGILLALFLVWHLISL